MARRRLSRNRHERQAMARPRRSALNLGRAEAGDDPPSHVALWPERHALRRTALSLARAEAGDDERGLTAPGARREPRGNRRRSRRPPPARGRECGNGATRRQGGHRPPASVRKQPRKASFHPISRALPTIGAEATGSNAIATAGPANPGQQRSACGQTAGHTPSFRSERDQRIHASRPPGRHPRGHRRNRGQNYHGRQEAAPVALTKPRYLSETPARHGIAA